MRTLFASLLILFASTTCLSQVVKDDPYKMTPTLEKLAEIDLANQLLPVLMTKDQIKVLLPVIEKCRTNVRAQAKKEADRLKALQSEIDKVYGEAYKGMVPSQEFLDKITALFTKFANERVGVSLANSLLLFEKMKETLNDGQKKAVVGVVDRIFNQENKKWEDGTADQKLQYFGATLILGDRGYDMLVKLSK